MSDADDGGVAAEDGEQLRARDDPSRRKGKERRVETLGQKKIDKEVYRKSKERPKGGEEQWSR